MRKHFPLVVFAVVAIACLALATTAYVAAQDSARVKFESTADEAVNRISSRVDLHIALLRSTQALFTSNGADMSRDEFKAYFDALDLTKNFSGLRAIGFLGLGQAGDEAGLEQRITRYQGVDHAVYPQSNEAWRTPIMLFEPMDASNMRGIGYDMFSDPSRRDAIKSAIETGEPQATGLVRLGQAIGTQIFPGFLVFAAVNGSSAATEPTAGKTTGLLYVAFRTDDLFKAALDRFPELPVHVEVFDGEAKPENMLFKSETLADRDFGDDFIAKRTLVVAGRSWTIQFRPTIAFSSPSSRIAPIMLGIVGLILAAAIAMIARYQGKAFETMLAFQDAAQKSLLEKDLMLQEMKHRIKNSITRVLAIARQTAGNAKDVKEFSNSFAARLQAMAASQDMLTRSSWQKADLKELLQIELSQVFGKELPDTMLSGPDILLSEEMTQALGLTFHELATNALKYGEASTAPNTLTVSWSLQKQIRKDDRLILTWRERSPKAIEKPLEPGSAQG